LENGTNAAKGHAQQQQHRIVHITGSMQHFVYRQHTHQRNGDIEYNRAIKKQYHR